MNFANLIARRRFPSHSKIKDRMIRKDEHIGLRLKTYNFIRKLGEGAWAIVYEAFDERTRLPVACSPFRPFRQSHKAEHDVIDTQTQGIGGHINRSVAALPQRQCNQLCRLVFQHTKRIHNDGVLQRRRFGEVPGKEGWEAEGRRSTRISQADSQWV